MRILCVGVGNYTPPGREEWLRLTTPASVRRENGRTYRYAPPGKLYIYGGEEPTPTIEDVECEMVSAYSGGPLIQGWGLVSISDVYSSVLKVPIEEQGIEQPLEQETKVLPAITRINDLMKMWNGNYPSPQYGALIIKGELPTEYEIEKAQLIRESSARERLNAAINDQSLAKHGHTSDKRGFTPADRFWAYEYGIVLNETVDSMKQVEAADGRVQCPQCAERIMAAAKLCVHCKMQFKKPVSEYLAELVEA